MTEGKHLLVTSKSKLYCAQHEANNSLTKYYRRNQTYNNQIESPERRKKSLVHNHLSTCIEALSKDNSTITNPSTQYMQSAYHLPVTISFKNNNDIKDDFQLSPSQKRKIQYDNQSITTNTTIDLTQQNETGRKDELSLLIEDNNLKLIKIVNKKKP